MPNEKQEIHLLSINCLSL